MAVDDEREDFYDFGGDGAGAVQAVGDEGVDDGAGEQGLDWDADEGAADLGDLVGLVEAAD